MKEVVIMTKDEYGQLIKRFDELEKTCTGLNVDLCWWHERHQKIYDYFNRPAIEEAERRDREDLLSWCESVAKKYEQEEFEQWLEYCDHKYNKKHYKKLP